MQISDLTTGIAFVIGFCLFPICLCIDNYLNERTGKKKREKPTREENNRCKY